MSPAAFAALDVSLEQLCARAGVPLSSRWDTDDFFRLWTAAEAEFDGRDAGLRFGAGGVALGYGVAATVALHAADFRGALAALSRYKRLSCPERVDVEANGDEVRVCYRWLAATGLVPRLLVDTCMASLTELARVGTAGAVAPIRVELARAPMDEALLRRHFGCPVVFSATHDAMVFKRAALEVPFVTADGGAFARVLQRFEQQLAAGVGFSGLLGELRLTIARQLSEGRSPSVDAVARRMHLSRRTLQRRLDESGTHFQQQLAEVRRLTASRLLANTELDTVAIALLLGFVEPNSFTRAFRTWERTTPLRWRERQRGCAA
ncbi:AraC family transcriptional regulator [Solimonas marina]|uniref:AraC family transcriptional regulator n=1 Tax=Solimonas marina TaxID=2714601 RepID=A0A969WC30_9GAMM|nr:AraC family transcriptional regulator [Solimonas marina]